jgi:hypothetical protein
MIKKILQQQKIKIRLKKINKNSKKNIKKKTKESHWCESMAIGTWATFRAACLKYGAHQYPIQMEFPPFWES